MIVRPDGAAGRPDKLPVGVAAGAPGTVRDSCGIEDHDAVSIGIGYIYVSAGVRGYAIGIPELAGAESR